MGARSIAKAIKEVWGISRSNTRRILARYPKNAKQRRKHRKEMDKYLRTILKPLA